MMPKLDGFELAKSLRDHGVETPIVFLTARSELDDRVRGLDMGGDAYVIKPFDIPELLAVIRAVVRRSGQQTSSIATFAGGRCQFDFVGRTLQIDEESVLLTARELDLLEALLHAQGRYCSREELLERVWGADYEGGSRVVDVYVRYLRRKLGDDVIQSGRGLGYRIP